MRGFHYPGKCLMTIPLIASAVAIPPVSSAASIFNFDSDTASTITPFTDTNNGLSASFGGQAAVCDVTGLFQSLTGQVLIQDYCVAGESGAISISFGPTNVSSISFNFATAGGADTDTLTVFEGTTFVGSSTFSSTVPSGGFNGEGIASFTGLFNNIAFASNKNDVLAIDNVTVTSAAAPEPASIALLTAGLGLVCLARRRASRPDPMAALREERSAVTG